MGSKTKRKKLKPMRCWLNPISSHDTGHMQLWGDYEEYDYDNGKKSQNLDLSLKIADCDRMITLSFWTNTKKEAKERLVKVRTMIKVLRQLESYLEKYENEPSDLLK